MSKQSIAIAFIILLAISAASDTRAAEPTKSFHPGLSIKEEYSDNLNLTSANEKEDSWTTIQPGFQCYTSSVKSRFQLDYLLGLVYYGKNSDLNYISHEGSMNLEYQPWKHINFSFKNAYLRSDEPREREYFTQTAENKYVLSIERQRAVYWRNVAAPTLEYQFGKNNRLGINYQNNSYRTQNSASQDSQENTLSPYLSYWFNDNNGISLDYGYTEGDFDKDPDMKENKATASYTYRMDQRSSLFAEYFHSRRSFDQPGVDYTISRPALGITYSPSPKLGATLEAGYYWMDSEAGSDNNGFSYMGELHNIDPITTYQISFQGGYTEDYFTAQNLGFSKYHRLTGSLKHMLNRHSSLDFLGSVERAEYSTGQEDTIWGLNGKLSIMPLKWLTFMLELSHLETRSNVDSAQYAENRAMFVVTATY